MTSSYCLRQARESDAVQIDRLLAAEMMPLPATYQQGTVAVPKGEEDTIVGFLHIALYDEMPYIAPVVVAPAWRGKGVGRALVDNAFERYPELYLVSEGRSCGFYEALGFEKMAWEQVASYPIWECKNCPDRMSCHPQPYYLKREMA